MQFLYPQFLYGLFALAIPVIVHLFNFRRAKKIYFSNNLFLKNVKKISSSKLKLKHYLVLAARLLFIVFLVLTFAQPFLPADEEGLNSENVLLYLDNSLSMSNEIASDLSAFEAGINYIDQITDLYPSNTRYKLLTNDFAPYSNNFKSKEEIKEIITEIKLSGITRTFPDIQNRLLSGNENPIRESDLYFVSDFQRSTLGSLSQFEIDTNFNHYLVPLQYRTAGNIFIDSIYLENPFLLENESNALNVVVANQGENEYEDLMMKLFVNEIQSANASLDMDPNSKQTISFPLNFNLDRVNQCRISFEEFPVTFDNDFYFTLNLTDRITILEIKDTDQTTNIGNVYANQSLFNLLSYSADNLDYSLINNADLIVLNELDLIDNSLLEVLDEYLNNDGDILIVPDLKADLEAYNYLIENEAISSSLPQTEDGKIIQNKMADPDFNNPFFENIFEETDENLDMPSASKVISWTDQVNVILKFRNEQPFLSQFKQSAGKVYLMASPIDEEFTNFYKHAIFVPVMYRIAALSMEAQKDLYYTLDKNLVALKLDSLERNEIYKLQNENGELIPAQQQNGNELILDLPKFALNAGFYNLALENSGDPKAVLAFNQDKKESELAQYDYDQIQRDLVSMSKVEIFEFDSVEDFGKEMKAKHMGVPLWKYMLMLSLIFLLAEILLIRFL